MKHQTMKSWAQEDRPREKLVTQGKDQMSVVELITLLIGHGKAGMTALEMSRELLSLCDNSLKELSMMSIDEMQKISGLGMAKAVRITAALELSGRKQAESILQRKKISCSSDVYEVMQGKLSESRFEEFWVIYLNRAHRISRISRISEGGIASTVADPRKILKIAIDSLASSLILCHNHPSGNLQPSESDIKLTRKLSSAAELIDMRVLDHMIISHTGYFSFADHGKL